MVFCQPREQLHKGRRFEPAIIVRPQYVSQVSVFAAGNSEWVAVVGDDIDGQDPTFLANTRTLEMIPTQETATAIFFSPSAKYLIIRNQYEGNYFRLLDTETGIYNQTSISSSFGNIFQLESAPVWTGDEEFFIVRATEREDPWNPNNPNRGRLVGTKTLKFEVPSLRSSSF
jgi:hypothetical protein